MIPLRDSPTNQDSSTASSLQRAKFQTRRRTVRAKRTDSWRYWQRCKLRVRVADFLCAAGLLALLGSVACHALFGLGECTDELGMHPDPAERTIRPGESFVARLELSTCGGSKRWRPTVIWRAADTTVVIVDSLSGRVTGRAAGQTYLVPVEPDPSGQGEMLYFGTRIIVRP